MADEIKVFNWFPSPGVQTSSEPRVLSSGMGDGYEERKADGINTDLKEYSLTFTIPAIGVKPFTDFLEYHKGVKSFMFYSPVRRKMVRVICKKWNETTHHFFSTFTATFNEVVK